jgi:MFS family permease
MGLSYAGDRLQELAQAWLVATISQSALAVGAISIVAGIPQLFMPLGGVIADQVDRRRLLVTAQLVGDGAALFVGILAHRTAGALAHLRLGVPSRTDLAGLPAGVQSDADGVRAA